MGEAIAIGMQVAGGIGQAAGEAKAASFKASEAAAAARYGKIAAAETDTAIRGELASVVGNIRAIRASSGIDPNSPTTQAIIDAEGKVSERQRRIQVGNLNAQVTSDQRGAKFLAKSGADAFLYGSLGTIGKGITSTISAYS